MEYQNITGPTKAQQEFIEREQMHKKKVAVWRMMLLVLLLAMWELCTRLGMMDAFIFSSPSRVLLCFWRMVRDKSIFEHIGITLMETLQCIGDSGAISGYAEQPSQVSPGSHADCLAWQSCVYHCGSSCFRCIIWLYFDPSHRISKRRSRKDQADLFPWGKPPRRAFKGTAAGFGSHVDQQHEGQHRALSGGRYYRRVSGGAKRAGIFDYLWESGISAGSGHDVHRFAVPIFYCFV